MSLSVWGPWWVGDPLCGRNGGRGVFAVCVRGGQTASWGCEAVQTDSLGVLVVHPGTQCGACKEGPPCARPLGPGSRTPRVRADARAVGSEAAVENEGRDGERCEGPAREGVRETQIL